jgi:hypothetical protein
VDYSPLTTAVIHSTSGVKDAPNTLAVRCHGPSTELLLRTEGAWRATHASEVQVDYRINDQPLVRLQWTVSEDGKTASYKGDAVGLLRSLPEGARLTISVFDRPGLGQEATFQLTELDRAAGRMISNLADKSLLGSGQMSELGHFRTPDHAVARSLILKNGHCHARSAGPFAAMCARLRVGKKKLDVAGLVGPALHYALLTLPTFTSRRLSGAIAFTPQARRVVCNARPWPSWPRPCAQSC